MPSSESLVPQRPPQVDSRWSTLKRFEVKNSQAKVLGLASWSCAISYSSFLKAEWSSKRTHTTCPNIKLCKWTAQPDCETGGAGRPGSFGGWRVSFLTENIAWEHLFWLDRFHLVSWHKRHRFGLGLNRQLTMKPSVGSMSAGRRVKN